MKMEQVEEMEVAKICEYSDIELKDFWCKHLKHDHEFDVMRQDDYEFTTNVVTSQSEECFLESYGNSSLALSDKER